MKKLYTVIFALQVLTLSAQTNTDFETADFTGWSGFEGDLTANNAPLTNVTNGIIVTGINAFTSNSPHIIVNNNFNSITCQGGLPVGQGIYSALLNFTSGNFKASGISQSFTVGSQNTMLVYSFSAFLTNGNHADADEAHFRVEVRDQNGTLIYQNLVFPGMPNSPLVTCNINSNFYSPWGCDTVPLVSYVGQSVTLTFIAGDCVPGGHDGYAFVDANCVITGQPEIAAPNTLTVFPNPANAGMVFLKQSKPQNGQWTVYDLSGQVVTAGTTTGPATAIDLTGKSKGIYFVEVVQADGSRQQQKILVQ